MARGFSPLGIKPSEFRSSIEAMARRVLRGNELPAINALVDIGNLISLRYIIPAGGHALDHVTQDIPYAGQMEMSCLPPSVVMKSSIPIK